METPNLTVRMGKCRFTRLTNGFSKKLDNHRHLVALFFLLLQFVSGAFNIARDPAMQAGISDHICIIEGLCGLLPETASAIKRIDKGLILNALGEKAG